MPTVAIVRTAMPRSGIGEWSIKVSRRLVDLRCLPRRLRKATTKHTRMLPKYPPPLPDIVRGERAAECFGTHMSLLVPPSLGVTGSRGSRVAPMVQVQKSSTGPRSLAP
jgi:hypothetical protein